MLSEDIILKNIINCFTDFNSNKDDYLALNSKCVGGKNLYFEFLNMYYFNPLSFNSLSNVGLLIFNAAASCPLLISLLLYCS